LANWDTAVSLLCFPMPIPTTVFAQGNPAGSQTKDQPLASFQQILLGCGESQSKLYYGDCRAAFFKMWACKCIGSTGWPCQVQGLGPSSFGCWVFLSITEPPSTSVFVLTGNLSFSMQAFMWYDFWGLTKFHLSTLWSIFSGLKCLNWQNFYLLSRNKFKKSIEAVKLFLHINLYWI
jgi:hypothetical protein